MTLHVLTWDLHKLTSVTRDLLLRAVNEVSAELIGTQGWVSTLVWTSDNSSVASVNHMLTVLAQRDVLIIALVDALESCSVKHFLHHRMQLSALIESSLALATLARLVCLEAETANDFVTTCAVSCVDGNVVTVCTRCAGKHSIWACVELLHLWLHLSD